ncbi:MAG TPA: hypothetical protein PLU72_18305 [Candidatus Ozemobacteraceae bacterium]|nr:hypothetical protein [Candidatus Ozemobacteraceae bacterium]HQG28413.1 hypothetical protein [Candidatus Ozemobacteraceae bacterium]
MIRKLLILALVAMILMPAVPASAQASIVKWRDGIDNAGAEHRIGHRYPLPIQELPFNEFLATGSQTVGTSAAVLLAVTSTDTRAVDVGAIGGVVNWGDATVPDGTAWPFTIASGSYHRFIIGSSTPKLYFRGQIATTTLHRLEL